MLRYNCEVVQFSKYEKRNAKPIIKGVISLRTNNNMIIMSTIIELTHRQRLEMTSEQLAEQCNTEESVLLPILVKLTDRGWVRYNPLSKLYRHGLGLLIFTKEERLRRELIRQCNNIMQNLSKKCNQTLTLNVIEGLSSICIHKIEPKNAIHIAARVGRESPLHAGSSAKVLLAYAPEAIRETLLSHPLPKITPLTITSQKTLRESLVEIRSIGYSYSIEEVDPGAAAITFPILDKSDNIIASLSIIGTRFAYEKERSFWKEMLLKAVKDIKKSL